MARRSPTRIRSIDGLLLIDKPAGVTSHDVVLAARRAFGESRIGHGGTLDPFATGLLVLLLGRATRLLPYLDGEPKIYEATIRFGAETDTDDLLGAVVRTANAPAIEDVRAAIASLTGEISQVPPAYSAKRVDGRRAYDAARIGEALELAPVNVRVHSWEIADWRGDELDVVISCGGGTYIRALARDLGRATWSAAHLSALRRTSSGSLSVQGAPTLETLRAGGAEVLPPLGALPALPVETLSEDEIARIARGIPV
ncbi:MAG: tRNA pseudouridine(55) synthase TruB, partial [Gemmatimonadota bacterium]|nr:tRNA pseudouridine(55) synthase TruB [Gemmatimonadota bacterium]